MATQLFQPAYGSLAWLREAIIAGAQEKAVLPVLVTPAMATQMLMLNTKNRSIKPKKAEQFRRAIKAGLWRGLNGETIKFKKDGSLGDGQHRLSAIAAETHDVMSYVMFGAEEEDIATVDQGTARTAADLLRLKGGEHSPERASIARMLIAYEESGGTSLARASTISNAEIEARAESDPRIMEAAHYASIHGRKAPGLYGSHVSLCWYLFSAIHRDAAEKYLEQVCSGLNLGPKEPAITVRDFLIRRMKNDQRARSKKIEAVMRGWNAFRDGRSYTSVVTNGTLPELI